MSWHLQQTVLFPSLSEPTLSQLCPPQSPSALISQVSRTIHFSCFWEAVSFGFWFIVKNSDMFMFRMPVHKQLCVCPVRDCSRFGDCHGEQLGEFERINLAEDVQGGCLAYSSLLKLCKFLILPFPAQTF